MAELSEIAKLNKAVDSELCHFQAKMRTLATLTKTQLKHATENRARDIRDLKAAAEGSSAKLVASATDSYEVASVLNSLLEVRSLLGDIQKFSAKEIVAEVIFVSVFSSFDAFLRRLLRTFYSLHAPLLSKLSDKNVQFGAVLGQTREEIVEATIEAEISSSIRGGYSRVLNRLAKRFECGTLKEFDNWPRFAECWQRRHLITHCDGHVTKEYLAKCTEEKVKHEKAVAVGDKLTISEAYLLTAIELVTEVGLKLGQVLWRSVDGRCVDAADERLGDLMFDFLKLENWELALRMGEFGAIVAKRRHTKPRKERNTKIILINYAQAAKWSGKKDLAIALLDGADWSGSAVEFGLAVACLNEQWDEAAELMKRIGPSSTLCPIHGYVGWPIFREFRATAQFLTTFRSIYKVEFTSELKKVSDNADANASGGSNKKERHNANRSNKKVKPKSKTRRVSSKAAR